MKRVGLIYGGIILAVLLLSTWAPVFMHLWERDRYAIINPFPFFDQPIHPQAWAITWLQRLRVLSLMGIILAILHLLPGYMWQVIRSIFWVAFVFEVIDIADWFLRYGQDILAKGFDANVLKIGAVTAVALLHIITFKYEKSGD